MMRVFMLWLLLSANVATAATCNNWWMENHPSSAVNAWYPGCLPTSSDVSAWNGYASTLSSHGGTLSSHSGSISSHNTQLSTMAATLVDLQNQINALESSPGGEGSSMGMTTAEGVQALMLAANIIIFAIGFMTGQQR